MRTLRILVLRVVALVRARDLDRELQDEIAGHLGEATDEYVRQGHSPTEARLAALRSFGGVTRTQEAHRDNRAFTWFDDARRDLTHGARLLARSPVFALTAVVSIAIGIGANATIFSAIDALLLTPAPGVANPQRLIEISRAEGRIGISPISYPNYRDIRDRSTTLDGVYGYDLNLRPMSLRQEGASGAEAVFGDIVTANYFAVLGVTPAAGRLFDTGRAGDGGASIAVLSYRFWTHRFNGDPSLVGRTVRLNDRPFTIVGVARAAFHGTTVGAPDVWVPFGVAPFTDEALMTRQLPWGLVGARLKAGVSIAQAGAEMDAVGHSLARDYPAENRDAALAVAQSSPIPAGLRILVAGFLSLLMGAVGLVLAIACANIAGVLLARAESRRREMAVRLAIGAGRARIIRQLLAETLLLFAIGGAGSIWLARGMAAGLLSMLPAFAVPIDVALPIDGQVVAFTAALTFLTSLASGLAPALHASKADVSSALKDTERRPSERLRLRHVFIVAQVACALLLVATASLLGRALANSSLVDQGFDPSGVEVASLDLSLGGYTRTTGPEFVRDLLNRLRTLPSIENASAAFAPPNDRTQLFSVEVPGGTSARQEPVFQVMGNAVSPGFFATLHMPLLAGRDFSHADASAGRAVAIVSDRAARSFWPGEPPANAVGKHILWSSPLHLFSPGFSPGQAPAPGSNAAAPFAGTSLEVVGVARDLGVRRPGDMRPFVYVPLDQQYTSDVTLLARSRTGERVANDIRKALTSMNGNLPVVSTGTLAAQGGPVALQLRLAAAVSSVVGAIGLILAAVGIYGIVSYTVARRTREIGIRVAIGAQRADVVSMVLGEGMTLVAIGGVIGLVLAAAAARLLTGLLFGVSPLDPVAFGGAALIFAASGVIASGIPALRATQISPVDALRND